MEPVRSLGSVTGAVRVQERGAGGGGKRDGDAFRRALEREANGAGDEAPADAEPPLRTQLQPKTGGGRRDAGTPVRHVDVIA